MHLLICFLALTQWSVQEVGEWIERICLFNDLKNYKHNFVNHQVDGSLLSQLKVKDLEEALGIPNKDAKTLEQHIQHLAKFIGNNQILSNVLISFFSEFSFVSEL
jgi:hypothetical protein